MTEPVAVQAAAVLRLIDVLDNVAATARNVRRDVTRGEISVTLLDYVEDLLGNACDTIGEIRREIGGGTS